MKSLVTGAVVAAVMAGVAAGVTSVASDVTLTSTQVRPVVFGVPLAPEPKLDTPSGDELAAILSGIADPNVSFMMGKGQWIEGGVGIIEGRTADRLLKNAAQKGYLPLSFKVTNIAPAPGGATATVTATGPQLAPVTQNVFFVGDSQTGWRLSKASATALLQSALTSS